MGSLRSFILHIRCSRRQFLYDTHFKSLNFSIFTCINPSFLGFSISTIRTLCATTVNSLINEYVLANYPAHYLVPTDNLMSKTITGYAFRIPSLNIKSTNNFPLLPSTFMTNFYTILEALYTIRSLNPRNCIIVYNFQTSILSLLSFSFVSHICYLILQIRAVLFSLKEFDFIIKKS